MIYSGTSGLVLQLPQAEYPEEYKGKSRLQFYSSLFNSVEINSTFYKMPKASTIIKWTESVDDNFRFTFKTPKVITHAKNLDYNKEDVDTFLEITSNTKNKKGCLLLQFPPSLKVDYLKKVQGLLEDIQSNNKNENWKTAVEFRNTTWFCEEVYKTIMNQNTSIVFHDLPASATPFNIPTSSFYYLRFHGPGGRYRGSYDDVFLEAFAEKIIAWSKENKVVFVYFNNTLGDAVKNLKSLNEMVI